MSTSLTAEQIDQVLADHFRYEAEGENVWIDAGTALAQLGAARHG